MSFPKVDKQDDYLMVEGRYFTKVIWVFKEMWINLVIFPGVIISQGIFWTNCKRHLA